MKPTINGSIVFVYACLLFTVGVIAVQKQKIERLKLETGSQNLEVHYSSSSMAVSSAASLYRYSGVVVSVVDADTFDIDIDLGFEVTIRKRCRLNRVDAYEVKNYEHNEPGEKEKGLEAKQWATDLLLGQTVHLESVQVGKYGRPIVEIEYDSLNFNDQVVELGYGTYKDESDYGRE